MTKLTKDQKDKHIRSGGMECPACINGVMIEVDRKVGGLSGEFRRGLLCLSCGASFTQVYKLKRVDDRPLTKTARVVSTDPRGDIRSTTIEVTPGRVHESQEHLGRSGAVLADALAFVRRYDPQIIGLRHRVLGSINIVE